MFDVCPTLQTAWARFSSLCFAKSKSTSFNDLFLKRRDLLLITKKVLDATGTLYAPAESKPILRASGTNSPSTTTLISIAVTSDLLSAAKNEESEIELP